MRNLKKSLGYALCIVLVVFTFCDSKAQTIDTTLTSVGRLNLDSIEWSNITFNSVKPLLTIREPFPTTTIHFTGDSTEFWLNMNGDSLVWGGDMKLTESAKTFINFCDNYWYSKIDSLETELTAIRKKYCN